MRRLVWFVGGVAAGAAGTGYTKRKVAAAIDRVRPSSVVASASSAARRGTHRIGDAVREGAAAARRRERELIAERDGRLVHLHEHLGDGDEVLVDGEVVEPGRVILLRRPDDRRGR